MAVASGVLLAALTGLDYRVGVVVITGVCVGYTLLGGLGAVIATDFIQSLLIMVGLLVVGVILFARIGTGEIYLDLEAERPALLSLVAPASILFLCNNLLFGLGEIFHSNVWWSRALAFRAGVGKKAFLIAGLIWLPVPIAAGAIALAAPVLGINVPSLDMVGPLVVAEVLGTAGAAIILVVVFASLSSSIDSLLAATSDLLVEDVYRGVLRPAASDRERRTAARAVVVALGLLAIGLSWNKLATLAELIQFTGAFVASTIWPIAAGLYVKSTNRTGATVAMIAGTAAGLWSYFAIGFFVAALVGASVSMVCVLVSTWLWPQPFDWARLAEVGR
jgi:Na+/proline symporter